jgi:seryl-tRNA synthetase
LEQQYDKIIEELNKDILTMPNTSLHADVPIGKDESENVVVKSFGDIPTFDFEAKDHMALMKQYDMIDVER